MFAETFPRNTKGWIKFPLDSRQRTALFPDAMEHPAKAHMFLVASLVDYLTEPGDTILDPFAGTGTILLAAMVGRKVICIDVEEGYITMLEHHLALLEPEVQEQVNLIQGDNRKLLPLPCDCIITSPPYAQTMRKKSIGPKDLAGKKELWTAFGEDLLAYSKSPDNLCNLNRFHYNQEMAKVYKLCYQSLKPGGSMAIIIKDNISNNRRIYLSRWVEIVCGKIGFKLTDWFKREAAGSPFLQFRRAKGKITVDDEDIMVFRKE